MERIFREEEVTDTIKKVSFSGSHIFITTGQGYVFNRALKDFPLLLNATEQQRLDFKISKFKDAIHWEGIDEDIHISSFINQKEANAGNPIAKVFQQFPELNISQVAEKMNINKSLLSNYIYGVKKPSLKRKKEIRDTLHAIGKQLLTIEL